MEYKISKNKVGDIVAISSFEVHSMANIVPLDEDLSSLVASIDETGLLHPIVLYKGKIIDGRRRTMACLELGIVPKQNDIGLNQELTEKQLYNIVIGESTRRNLTIPQKAVVAAKETLAGNHTHTKFKTAPEYAKVIWGIGISTLKSAKWLVKNHKRLADNLFEEGFCMYDGKKWTGIKGLVDKLKTDEKYKEEEEKVGAEDKAKEIALLFNAVGHLVSNQKLEICSYVFMKIATDCDKLIEESAGKRSNKELMTGLLSKYAQESIEVLKNEES